MAVKKESSFLKGPILPSLMKFTIPVLFAMFLQATYGAVDLWVVGKYSGPADVSAVATGSQTMLIITGIIMGLSMGTTVLIGQKVGERDDRAAADVIGATIWIFGILSVFLSIIMLLMTPKIALIMNVPEEAFQKTINYITICSIGTIFIVAYNVISSIFRGLGNSRAPLLFVGIACLVNIACDLLFVKIFGMDSRGTAIATILAQAISVIFSIVLMIKGGLSFSVSKENLKFKPVVIKKIIKLGSPIALQDMCNEVSFLVLIGIVNSLGLTASAGVGVAERLVMFMLLIPLAYMSSISAFVAQNIGAGQEKRAKKTMWVGMSTASLFGIIMSYLSFFHGDILSRIFTSDPAVIEASSSFLKATAIECLALSTAFCFTGYFNGIGRTNFVMIQGLLAVFLVRIPYAYFASKQANPTIFNIGMSAAWTAIFTLVICLSYYMFLERKETIEKASPECSKVQV
ncbi:MAG: MATE family efflux transporter [Tissierella sp.]|uniref:MATE family efflux transporter n=1 Tax=Tissierella sp. TaxID=41274 RepID=UPI003F963465